MKILFGNAKQILAVVDNLAAFHDGVAGQNTKDSFGRNGFTGTGLTYDGQGFALGKIEIDAADCLYLTVGGTERYCQISDGQFIFHIIYGH